MNMTNVILIGFGPVGQLTCSYLLQRKNLNLVGVIDVDPAKKGKPISEWIKGQPSGITVSSSIDEIKEKASVALVATASKLVQILPTLKDCAKHGLHVVSTCEELIYPWIKQPELSKTIDQLGRENNVAFLGTGVNPGFLMDFLPIALTGVCNKVHSITVKRIQNASTRRIPFQNKIGAGLTTAQFDEKLSSGNFGHVGLTESAQMIGHAMGWSFTGMKEEIKPVIDEKTGLVAGIEQQFFADVAGTRKLTMYFRAALNQPDPKDYVLIEGEPRIESIIPGATHGDAATVSIVINAVSNISRARPGLVTMLDMPVIHSIG